MTRCVLPVLLLIAAVLGCALPNSRRLSQPAPTEPTAPSFTATIEYTKPRWSNEANVYFLLSFEVKNTSSRPLEFVKMDASFYDKDDNLIRSEQPYISKYTRLSPGERSSAEVQTRYDPAIKSVRIEFSCNGDRSFEKVNVTATQVAKIR